MERMQQSSPILMEDFMVSDSKKIKILERELDEKDKQIEELTAEIEELQSVID